VRIPYNVVSVPEASVFEASEQVGDVGRLPACRSPKYQPLGHPLPLCGVPLLACDAVHDLDVVLARVGMPRLGPAAQFSVRIIRIGRFFPGCRLRRRFHDVGVQLEDYVLKRQSSSAKQARHRKTYPQGLHVFVCLCGPDTQDRPTQFLDQHCAKVDVVCRSPTHGQ
jgi:hypothetical protein